MSPRESFGRYLRLPRISVLPAVLAGASASYDPSLRPQWSLLVAFGIFLFATADSEATLLRGFSRATAPRFFAALLVSLLAGVILVAMRGWPMFWIVITALMVGTAFVVGPRLSDTALAGPATILWMGPLGSAGAALALTGVIAPPALWIGVPIGFLADAARRAHTAARAERLAAARAPLVPTAGPAGPIPVPLAAPPWFAGDIVAGFGAVPALIFLGGLPWVALLALVMAPWALYELARARAGYDWRDAAMRSVVLHMGFALALAVTTLAARMFATRSA